MSDALAVQLLELIEHDSQCCTQLLALIEQEYEALQQRNLDILEDLLNSKQAFLAQLDQGASQRSQLLAQHSLKADLDGLKQLASQASNGQDLLDQAQNLSEQLHQCQQANLRNGRLIQASQHNTRQMLNLLRGNSPQDLYDKQGGAARINSSRPISQA